MSDDPAAILEARARELALARTAEPEAPCVLLPFEAGGQRFAVEVSAVRQVLEAERVHPLLGTRPPVIGAVGARTRPVPVLDARAVLGLPAAGLADLRRVVVVEDEGDLYGLAVERVGRRIEVPTGQLRPGGEGTLLRFVAPGRLGVIDVSRLGLSGPVEAGP